MNTEKMLQTPSAESNVSSSQDPQRASAGQLMRVARERARMTPDELATLTKLPRHTIQALEQDDYGILNEQVYIRGYYRKCAKVLGLTDKELIDAYDLMAKPQAPVLPSKLRLASGAELGSGSRLPVALAIIAAIVAVLVCAFMWFARGERPLPASITAKAGVTAAITHDQTAAASVTAPATPVGAEVPAPVAPADAGAAAAPAVALGTVAAQPQGVPAQKLSSSIATTADSVNTADAADGTYTLTVTAESWARVNDATGKILINGLMRPGDQKTLSGTVPFKVFLGNASGVRVEQNGKTLDVSRYTAADTKTARFSLPLGDAQ
ncbi:MAG: helix-turn-helix domain-containing protein [Stenotrophobium sp.]